MSIILQDDQVWRSSYTSKHKKHALNHLSKGFRWGWLMKQIRVENLVIHSL